MGFTASTIQRTTEIGGAVEGGMSARYQYESESKIVKRRLQGTACLGILAFSTSSLYPGDNMAIPIMGSE